MPGPDYVPADSDSVDSRTCGFGFMRIRGVDDLGEGIALALDVEYWYKLEHHVEEREKRVERDMHHRPWDYTDYPEVIDACWAGDWNLF